ncbi:7585_t:CDS:2 [Gigaspora margarita]|uniref:7585_t:CDS:1 n=1 Tax=Gigaspora margarita TaxID=4874 RepID=A0ABN7VHD5_GIGMA|nr:7585_t:CDS:2 [Gigaspora margarita]
MDHIIPIHMVQVNSIASNGAFRSLKDILFVLIPKLAYSKSAILQVGDIIHIKLKQQNCVPDKLHIMLHITDVLFEYLFFKLLIKLTFNKKQKNNEITVREQIESTIYSISVNIFKFKEPEAPKRKWHWTSLMGPDKLIILNKFPVTSFILGQ